MPEPFRIGGTGAPAPATGTRPAAAPGGTTGASFGDVLAGKLQQSKPVTFSGHALQRLERRGIAVDDQTLARLGGAVDRAAAKGSRSSVVLVDDNAFVVSVPNRTVITAVDREHMKEQVFTNIDSAVIA
ncbi:MAG TPA: TIGR02530 family flagellar biosynthesis protein [Solirubrobacteraceae bacterium]|nr:TIGR02530 family flagellar biosynthesis protein [Solirubrobacteraceae bacterium]